MPLSDTHITDRADSCGSNPESSAEIVGVAYFLDELTDTVTYIYGWLRINEDVSGSQRLDTFSVNWHDADRYGYIRITDLQLPSATCRCG